VSRSWHWPCRTVPYVARMASLGELAEQRWDMIPRRVRGTVQRGFVFDPGTRKCQNIKCPCRGSRYRGDELVRPSSEAESHPRGRPALERGETSPEGAIGPRARRNLTRGGDQPSSEAEFRPRVAGPTALVGRWGHQGHGPGCWAVMYLKRVLGSFVFCFLRK
jgi:hypothetical protein